MNVPARVALAKPALGAPCNGCGLCCKAQPCKLAIEFLGERAAPCAALEHDGERHRCGLVANPARYLAPQLAGEPDAAAWFRREMAPKFAFLLGLGKGCDADDT